MCVNKPHTPFLPQTPVVQTTVLVLNHVPCARITQNANVLVYIYSVLFLCQEMWQFYVNQRLITSKSHDRHIRYKCRYDNSSSEELLMN